MTTKTMMQQAWDNWHADTAPDDIPGINPSFQEGWERCAELHAGIDMDKLNTDLIDYREQIERLQYEADAIPAIKAERDAYEKCADTMAAAHKVERDALKDAARLALDVCIEMRRYGNQRSVAMAIGAEAALKAVL